MKMMLKQIGAVCKRVACVGMTAALMAVAGGARADWSLQFNGTSQQVGFGAATATLGASTFTIECWFKRTGAGATTSTGTGGITAVPLVAKGRGEADGNNKDCNYFFGITTANVLGADFEEGAGQASPGLNHPVTGTTTILNDQWYHGAVTFDGTTWRLYLNGALDATLDIGPNRLPRQDSIQHASLATALTSANVAAGFFAGRLDEVRIWNHARSQTELLANMRAKVPTATGLLARWSLDEGTGTTIASTAGTSVNGTLVNTPTWNTDTPFAVVPASSAWKYLDNGSNLGTAWRATAFNDSTWASGPAELGYGDGGEATVVGYGSDANNKYITTYFRHTFQVTDATRYSGLHTALVRDDGAVVYLNGVELLRSNMPAGDILYNTLAASPEVSGSDESKWFEYTLPSSAFVEGLNVLAVEVHQQRVGSSDISFNLKLAASRTDSVNLPPTVALTAPAAGATLPTGTPVALTTDAADGDGSIALVEFFANGVKVGDAAVSPFTYAWTPTAAGRVALTAKATDNGGAATTSAAVNATIFEAGTGALQFDGTDDHVTFGTATNLGASAFTLECWMRRLGSGVTANTGNGGVFAIPLIAKGRGENENSNVDCNYFLGFLPSGALAADFEQFYADGAAAGQNYPVTGVSTTPGDGQWHHVAATYDGSNWVLYVDGTVDRTLYVGKHTPRFDSIQHAALGTAMNSSGVREGAFEGVLDEVRIWNYARTATQLAASRDKAVAAANGLLARWSLDEATGTSAANSIPSKPIGTLVNSPLWCLGRTLEVSGPAAPVVSLTAPADGATVFANANLTLTAEAFDDDGSIVSIAFLAGETELGSATSAPYGFTWTTVSEGTHALRAVATDNDGLAATSTVVSVSAVVRNDPPILSSVSPTDGASVAGNSATLQATATDPEGQTLAVRFYGRVRTAQPSASDFTVVVLPDTQNYSKSLPQTFNAQTDWIVAQRTARNIAYVAHVGDITEDAPTATTQWANANAAMARLEDPVTTGLPNGIPYGIVPGNHDHTSGISYFDQYFGASRFQGRPYYGDHFGSDNRNHYDLVTAGGMDFIFVFVNWNYSSIANYAELNAWANGVIQAHPDRRAVVVSHAIIDTSANFNTDNGQALFTAVKDNPNLFLMLNGHYHGEAHRTETVNGNRIDICLSDYQNYANGGDGFLRLYEFSPSNNVIRVKTYSPTLNQYENDASSQFEIPVTMAAPADPTPFTLIGTVAGLASGSATSAAWQGLDSATEYEWYVEADDGVHSVTGAVRAFTTDAAPEPVVSVSNPYADVDWSTVGTFKGNLHTHTTQSDGNQAPSAVLDGYQAQNYDFLAVTDHDFVTYPWSTYGRDPLTLGMTDIQGNELSQGHHIVSLFSGYASSSTDAGVLLPGVANAGGISFFAHPGRYSYNAQWYADYYTAQPSCFGMEIYNQGDRYTGDRVKWDAVLSILMPNRSVWGLSNDDSHDASHIGRNRTYLLAPSVSQADVRTALEAGAFFATYSTSSAHVPPMLTNVVIDAVAGTITVQGTGFTQVRWISQGTQVATGATLDLLNTSGVAKYVRAELHGTEGIGYTNPFGLLPLGDPVNQAPTVSAGSDQAITLPAAATLAGSASDDNLPAPPAALTLLWVKVSGLGTVTFTDDAAAQTTATFSEAGTYVLRLTANDGALSATDDVTVAVNTAALPGVSFGPTGTGTLTFDSLPPASAWATGSLSTGKDGFTTAVGLDAGVVALNQSAVAETLIGDTVESPLKRNRAVWTSGGSKFIQLSATSVGAVLLKGTLVNDSGTPISSLRVAYDYTVVETSAEEVPGLRVFYSLTGAADSWTLIPAFSGLMDSQALETTLTFGTPWQPDTQLFLMWADENSAADVERKYLIDNFAATPADLPPSVSVSNPYADVNWSTVGTFKGNLHTHTTNSDGTQAPAAVLDGYQAQNYDFLAVTDHDFVTYPWTTYGRNPLTLGMMDLQGNELSQGHHTVSLFNGFASSSADETTLLSGVAAAGGISFFAHPGRYTETAQWYADHYLAQPTCIGQEIYNQGDRYTGDRVKWDAVLSILMPNRPVWGFSNDDSHQASHIGRNRTYLLAPSVSQADVRTALEAGAFFATYSTSSAHVPPMLTNVVIDAVTGTITVQGTGFTQVRWISQGTQVATGATLDLLNTSGVAKYVRAELHGTEGIGYTNPFGLLPLGDPINQAPTVSAGSDQGIKLPATATLVGSASDDNLPNPPAALTLLWEKVSGLGTVTFADPATAQTTATFSEAGTYVLRLTASDGALSAVDDVIVTVEPAPAPAPAVWIAYNDCVFQNTVYKHANATSYNIGSGSPGPATGALRDLASGTVLPVTVTLTQSGGVVWQPDPVTGGSDCATGTDADQTFGTIVSMGGVVYYGSAGWTVDATITGLDPAGVYEFATSANRNASNYPNRRSIYTLLGADAFHAASTPGVVVDGAAATFNTGDNTAHGYVARWVGIRPGADGSFTVRATHAPDAESGNKAYAFDVFLIGKSSGFKAWAQGRGLRGGENDFAAPNSHGVPQAMEYACGSNLVVGEPLLTIRNVNGRPVIDVPAQDPASMTHVRLVIEGATSLSGPWSLPTRPAADTTGKPSHRAWFEAESEPETAFFRLVAQPVD